MTSKRPRLFYGWWIVAVSAAGLFLGAPLAVFSFSVFFKALVANFHAGRAAVSFAFSLANTVGALWIPVSGMLIDRFGAKRVIVPTTLFYGLTLISALWVGNNIWHLYLFYSLLGLALSSGPSPVPYGAVLSHWFNRRRGLALGLAMLGIGVGSMVVPILAQRLIAIYGWRMTYAAFGGAVLLLPLPIVARLLFDNPWQLGLVPDGDRPDPLLSLEDKAGLTWSEIRRNRTFWMLIFIFSLTGASVHGAILHMSAIFTDRGVSAERAAVATSMVGAALIVGRLGSGYLMDRMFAPRVAMLFYGATTVGMAFLWAGTRGPLAMAASFLVGLGMGAEVETMGFMISRYFGLRAFGTAYGHAFGAFMLAGAGGVLLMGAGFDHFRSYTVPLACFCAAMVLALLLLSQLGPYRYAAAVQVDSLPLTAVSESA